MHFQAFKPAALAFAASALLVCAVILSSQDAGRVVLEQRHPEKHEYDQELNSYDNILSFPPARQVVKQKGVEAYDSILSFPPSHQGRQSLSAHRHATKHRAASRGRHSVGGSNVARIKAISEAKGQAKELQHILSLVKSSEQQEEHSAHNKVPHKSQQRQDAVKVAKQQPSPVPRSWSAPVEAKADKPTSPKAMSQPNTQAKQQVVVHHQLSAKQLEAKKEKRVWQKMEQSMEAELQSKKAKCVKCLEEWSADSLHCVRQNCNQETTEDSAQLKLNNQIASLLHQCMGGSNVHSGDEAAKRVVVDRFLLPWRKPFQKREVHSWVKVRWTGQGLHGLGLISGNTQSVVLRGDKTASGARLFCKPGVTMDDQLRPLMAEQDRINRVKVKDYYRHMAANHDALESLVDTTLAKDAPHAAVLSWMEPPKKKPESAWKVGLSKVEKQEDQTGVFDPAWAPTVAQHEKIKHHVMDRAVKRRLREEMKVVKLERELRRKREALEHPDQEHVVSHAVKPAKSHKSPSRIQRRLERKHYMLLATLRKLKRKIKHIDQ